jgi:hypothetical protein
MAEKPVPRRVLLALVGLAVVLPIAAVVSFVLGQALGAMGDQPGPRACTVVAVVCFGVWIVDLICLVLAQAINALADSDEPPPGAA